METKSALTRIDITGALDIYNAAEQRQHLLDALGAGKEVEIDLSQVSEIDSAGVQLMIAAKREAAAQDKTLSFTGQSQTVCDVLEPCNLAGSLGDPASIQPRT